MMRTYRVPQTDLTISRIAYGCADLGWERGADGAARCPSKEPLAADSVERAARVVAAAHESGVNIFDLAKSYGSGKSEQAFAEVLKRSPGLRDEIVIQTKCSSGRPGPLSGALDFRREQTIEGIS
nr:aldo/keto reductase [Sphingomonas sp. Y57]